ncbi:MAG TPA: hypothetical protein PLT47_06360 [Bacteroidales bacterium]|nr:hypothetical protein [Bacteroidales bacterium]
MGKKYAAGFRIIFMAVVGCVMLFFNSACKKTDLVPSYIHIDKIDLNTTYEFDGSNSCKITDAWVYIDGDLQGIYELPATFPVLANGQHTIMVRAGIKLNGIAMSRAYYSYYQPWETTVLLTAEQTDTLHPTVTYYENKIHWKEDFETAGMTLLKFTNSDTNFIQTQDSALVFEGASSGVANMDATAPYLLSVSDQIYEIPQNQSPVFLELNYKTNAPLAIGLFAVLNTGMNNRIDVMVLNPNTTWNKIYINLTPAANVSSNVAGYKVFFESYKPENQASAEVLLDNIKLLYTE